jgi:hypothetical protein
MARVSELLPAAELLGASSGNLIYTLPHGASQQAGTGAFFRYAEAVARGDVSGVSLNAVRRHAAVLAPLHSLRPHTHSFCAHPHPHAHAHVHTTCTCQHVMYMDMYMTV